MNETIGRSSSRSRVQTASGFGRVWVAFILLLVMCLSACTQTAAQAPISARDARDSSGDSSSGNQSRSDEESSLDDPTSAGGSAKGNDSGGSAGTPDPAPQPTPIDHAAGTQKAPLEIELAKDCVAPGGTQTIRVRSTPLYSVSWATLWPDQKAHFEWKGWSSEQINGTGQYSSVFTVPPHAPVGEARTDVSVVGETNDQTYSAFGNSKWQIKRSC